MKKVVVDLFDKIQHGDLEHREWLRDQLIDYFNDLFKPRTLPKPQILVKEDFTIKQKDME